MARRAAAPSFASWIHTRTYHHNSKIEWICALNRTRQKNQASLRQVLPDGLKGRVSNRQLALRRPKNSLSNALKHRHHMEPTPFFQNILMVSGTENDWVTGWQIRGPHHLKLERETSDGVTVQQCKTSLFSLNSNINILKKWWSDSLHWRQHDRWARS
jgi:hypothetical protein